MDHVKFYVKGIVHPKMKICLLSTHSHASGGLGEVFYSKRCRSFTGKRRGSYLQSNHGEW